MTNRWCTHCCKTIPNEMVSNGKCPDCSGWVSQAGAVEPTEVERELIKANETIKQLIRALRKEVEGPSITVDIDRHALTAKECPPDIKVITVYSIKHLLSQAGKTTAPPQDSERLRVPEGWAGAHNLATTILLDGIKPTSKGIQILATAIIEMDKLRKTT